VHPCDKKSILVRGIKEDIIKKDLKEIGMGGWGLDTSGSV
jgi:hypothetical protein